MVAVVWLKRDLRLTDHAAFWQASQTRQPVLPLFVVERDYWAQSFASRRHWCFIRDCLYELQKQCQKLGQSLVIRIADDALDAFKTLSQHYPEMQIFAHEETGNDWTYQRDLRVSAWCRQANIKLTEFPCNGVIRRLPHRDQWSALRQQRLTMPLVPTPVSLRSVVGIWSDPLPAKDDPMFGEPVPGVVQHGGHSQAQAQLQQFLYEQGSHYLGNLSAPGASERTCSRLSTFLAYGVLSVREVLMALDQRLLSMPASQKKQWSRSLSAFRSRLSWRDHFIQKLEDQPSIELACMHSAFEGMRPLPGNTDYLRAWQMGQTGYPFVDACMRSLNHTGWITFRMRAMLVSFASYHLWLDWRETGKHLARVFTDYEPGIHYSQLQMQSGVTGINALRMYSPVKQSQEHDPQGHFIKKWLPELRRVPPELIHEPWLIPPMWQQANDLIIGRDYPCPIVDHQTAMQAARAKISEVRKQTDFKQQAGQVYQKLGSRRRVNRSKTKGKTDDTGQLSMDLD